MEAFVKTLQGRMEDDLQKIDPEVNAVKGYDHRLRIIGESIRNLKQYVTDHPFRKPAAEIYYARQVAPFFYSQYFYYVKLHNAAVKKISCEKEDYHDYLKKELKMIHDTFQEYGDFYQYFISGKDCLDEKYYTEASRQIWSDHLAIVTENSLSLGSYRAACVLAYKRYAEYITQELKQPDLPGIGKKNYLEFKGTKSQIVELAVSLSESKLFHSNGQPAALSHLKDWLEEQLALDLKDFYTIDRNNRARKKEPTPFLSMLAEKYNSRLDHLLD